MPTFKHSGDLGDILFSLPAVRELGGGTLYLDPLGGASSPFITTNIHGPTKLTQASIDLLRPLLLLQPYITDVQPWTGQPVNFELDLFRRNIQMDNIADMHLAAFGLPLSARDAPWLHNIELKPIPGHPVVISRSPRYHGNHGFWEDALRALDQTCIFVGLPKEHEIMEYTFNRKIPYHPTPTFMELAQVIAGAAQFIGNASFAHALAEAMKRPLIVEYYRPKHRINFQRTGAQYI